MNRFNHPTLEESLGPEIGRETRELFADATFIEAIECIASNGFKGLVALCGGEERFKREADDPIIAFASKLTRLKIVLNKVQAVVDAQIQEMLD